MSRGRRRLLIVFASVGGLQAGCRAARAPLPPAPPPLVRTEAVQRPTPKMPVALHQVMPTTDTHANGLVTVTVAQPGAAHAAVVVWLQKPTDARGEWLATLSGRVVAEYIDNNTPSSAMVEPLVETGGFGVAIRCLDEDLAVVMRQTGVAIQGSAFESRSIGRQLTMLAKDIERGFRGILTLGRTMTYRSRYGEDHPFSRDSAHAMAELLNLTGEDITAFVRRSFQPQRVRVAVVARPEILRRVNLRAPFRGWARGTSTPSTVGREVEVPPAPTDTKHRIGVMGSGAEQAWVMVLHVGPARWHPDYGAFITLCEQIGAYWGTLNQTYRHLGGLTYGLTTWQVERSTVTECFFGGSVQNDAVISLLDDYQRQLAALRTPGTGASIATRVQGRKEAGLARRYEEPVALARWLAENDTPRSIDRVALNDRQLRRVAEKYFRVEGWDVAILTGSWPLIRRLNRKGSVALYNVETRDR